MELNVQCPLPVHKYQTSDNKLHDTHEAALNHERELEIKRIRNKVLRELFYEIAAQYQFNIDKLYQKHGLWNHINKRVITADEIDMLIAIPARGRVESMFGGNITAEAVSKLYLIVQTTQLLSKLDLSRVQQILQQLK
jgi:hypothetical protein